MGGAWDTKKRERYSTTELWHTQLTNDHLRVTGGFGDFIYGPHLRVGHSTNDEYNGGGSSLLGSLGLVCVCACYKYLTKRRKQSHFFALGSTGSLTRNPVPSLTNTCGCDSSGLSRAPRAPPTSTAGTGARLANEWCIALVQFTFHCMLCDISIVLSHTHNFTKFLNINCQRLWIRNKPVHLGTLHTNEWTKR